MRLDTSQRNELVQSIIDCGLRVEDFSIEFHEADDRFTVIAKFLFKKKNLYFTLKYNSYEYSYECFPPISRTPSDGNERRMLSLGVVWEDVLSFFYEWLEKSKIENNTPDLLEQIRNSDKTKNKEKINHISENVKKS